MEETERLRELFAELMEAMFQSGGAELAVGDVVIKIRAEGQADGGVGGAAAIAAAARAAGVSPRHLTMRESIAEFYPKSERKAQFGFFTLLAMYGKPDHIGKRALNLLNTGYIKVTAATVAESIERLEAEAGGAWSPLPTDHHDLLRKLVRNALTDEELAAVRSALMHPTKSDFALLKRVARDLNVLLDAGRSRKATLKDLKGLADSNQA